MIDRRATTLTITFALLAGLASQAMAQTKPLRQSILEYGLDTGLLDNVAARSRVVFEQTLDMGDVPWMRIEFATVRLTRQSHIILESLADGAVQTLNARNMARWGQTSAYFNGGLVQLTVVASQRSFDNRVRIERVQVGQWLDPNVQERQCGPTDDRVSSTEPERGRLLAVGCTATIYDPNSCLITAGHCLASGSLVNVLEFNVPPSLADGTIQHPGPEDQYAVVASSRRFLSAGVGNDWGLFKVSPNSETGLMPFEAQGAHLTLADTTPDTPGLQLNIVGYGTDVGPDNLTQQIADGPIVSLSRNQLAYEIDTEGGNSGSTVVSVDTGQVVAIHTHGGCTPTDGANFGTAITHRGLQRALADFCAPPGPIVCADVRRFLAFCFPNGTFIAIVSLNDSSHDGQSVTVDVDGTPHEVTIRNRRARLQMQLDPGSHTASLVDPQGCADPIVVDCP